MSNEELLEKAENAITELFSDMTVSKKQALENMNALLDKVQEFADILEVDILKEELCENEDGE